VHIPPCIAGLFHNQTLTARLCHVQGSAEDAGKKPKVKVVSANTGYASSSPSTAQTAMRALLPILVVLIAVYFAFLRK